MQATTKQLSILFFLEWTILLVIKDAVRKALIYNMVFQLVFFLNVILISLESRKWKKELLLISNQWASEWLQSFVEKQKNPLVEMVTCPILFIGDSLFLILSWVYSWLSQFEVGKKLSSELFKRKLEEAAADGHKQSKGLLPVDYLAQFAEEFCVKEDTRVRLARSPLNQCVSLIRKWQTGDLLDDVVILYGNYGIGKTTLLNSLSDSLQDLEVKYKKYTQKVISSTTFYAELSELLGTPFASSDEFSTKEKSLPKTIVMLDDIHNLYLNKAEGLDAYRALIDLVSIQAENVFWCFTCNERAWVHLKGLFGKSHFLGPSIELHQWSDAEIQDLILKRHQVTGYRLKFDRVISAVHRGDVLESSGNIEAQFFRLLWGQSRGNPLIAQQLWVSATKKIGEKIINVTVPDFAKTRTLTEADDDTFLVLAALVKHEALSYKELIETSSLPERSIKHALKYSEDGGLIKRGKNNRWILHPKSQYIVHSQLLGKNFIYE